MESLLIQLRQLLSGNKDIKLAILFGSLASDKATKDSDIDLAILTEKVLPIEAKISLIEKIAEQFGRPVDLIDIKTAGEPLTGEILKGVRILGSDAQYAQVLSKHLVDRADFLPLQQRILKERRDAWIKS